MSDAVGYEYEVDVVRARRGVRLAVATGAIVLAVIGFAAFELASHVTPASQPGAGGSPGRGSVLASRGSSPSAGGPSSVVASPSVPVSSGTPSAAASARPTTPSASPGPGSQVVLPVDGAVAFGPSGTSDGDNPQQAGDVVSDPASGWMTDWYATSAFGDLKQGTGLLLDMGHTVTITTVRVDLGQTPGAALELQAGAQPAVGGFRTLAVRQDVGGAVTLTAAKPVQARYVLLWFTKLPPDGNGTYQAFVHGVTVNGRP